MYLAQITTLRINISQLNMIWLIYLELCFFSGSRNFLDNATHLTISIDI